ncbi:hypothetical protein CA13_55500 [Planctomycetes bacterium CA13]|uniref:Uncharacterized protein n=1 Tax=Novipirellula herctigrandis TaxID=2527986 RepID=A0A5C5Z9S7_9BACT|nr:hypothetical protein CA13_55500 [Planctomycetes bacterium CA13]
MDANEARLKEKLDHHLKEATRVAAEIQALEQGDEVPHFDQIELPAHALGQRFSRAIQEERAREVALQELGRVYCPDCKKQCKVEIEPRPVSSMDGPIELTEPVAHCRRCRRSIFPSADKNGLR